ncbi:hypothetical protein, conserved [Trypanosoma brucei gambiense DAL972]|uniref:STI1 domain-containing protein n=2 Tax=Trypanosoma brucei TaxID=5691 RepID=C9ZR70_TRYB9|nr:hypothetical protein, conserved [Trypanosoma brucei gambiense DAL972]RHW72260.1 small glutamine-rich tetratricopeptide repeat protein [Trypanosoma brucei equiperdum]CBH11900.1 hypothetical protein, conserved [Trypanosoma brucei gambiense DAL972]|eukprot:XP_011774185.1 hypothetical protein, conserved [Trypanosoma brucei gambiense DAL972]
MSGAAEGSVPVPQAVTEDYKKLIFSFIQMIRSTETSTPDRVTAIVQLLGEEYGVDPAGVGGCHDTGVALLPAFQQALNEMKKSVSIQQDDKFNAFLDLLRKKGYFAGAEEGSEEYNSRLEKAREKFEKRNNPYEGMTAEEIKNKGNELMGLANYKQAVAYYTKAIEMEPENHVFFANRAAAHTHLKDYRSAIIDCERSISICPTYAKAYSRLGTTLFYQENYQRAVDAFSKACELDPTNERYREDLKQVEEKAKQSNSATAGMGGTPFGADGMFNFSQVAEVMKNPQFVETATRLMSNPQFNQAVVQMASRIGGLSDNPEEVARLMGSGMGMLSAGGDVDFTRLFGDIDREALERFKEEEAGRNPRLRAIMEDVQRNGPSAFQQHMNDPEVMNLMLKFQNVLLNNGGGGANGGASS